MENVYDSVVILGMSEKPLCYLVFVVMCGERKNMGSFLLFFTAAEFLIWLLRCANEYLVKIPQAIQQAMVTGSSSKRLSLVC